VHQGRAACRFFTSLLHQSVTRGMSGRDRGMLTRKGRSRKGMNWR